MFVNDAGMCKKTKGDCKTFLLSCSQLCDG